MMKTPETKMTCFVDVTQFSVFSLPLRSEMDHGHPLVSLSNKASNVF